MDEFSEFIDGRIVAGTDIFIDIISQLIIWFDRFFK
jgi:hypothetical protein